MRTDSRAHRRGTQAFKARYVSRATLPAVVAIFAVELKCVLSYLGPMDREARKRRLERFSVPDRPDSRPLVEKVISVRSTQLDRLFRCVCEPARNRSGDWRFNHNHCVEVFFLRQRRTPIHPLPAKESALLRRVRPLHKGIHQSQTAHLSAPVQKCP